MKVSEKVSVAERAISFIATHDDATEKEVEDALDALESHITNERKAMRKRRKEAATAKEK